MKDKSQAVVRLTGGYKADRGPPTTVSHAYFNINQRSDPARPAMFTFSTTTDCYRAKALNLRNVHRWNAAGKAHILRVNAAEPLDTASQVALKE